MSQDRVAIFPAAGALGTSTYEHVLKLLPGRRVVLISRNPSKVPEKVASSGAELRRADYNDPNSFKDVFDGISYLFLVSYPSIEIEHRFESHKLAITAALDSNPGIKHVFYTSLGFAGDDLRQSAAHVMQAHLKTEDWLRLLVAQKPELTFTAIRQGIYSESYPMYTAFYDVKQPIRKVRIPHNGSEPGVAWVSINDLGEANARIIDDYVRDPSNDKYHNKIILLSGSRVWTLEETVALLGKYAGTDPTIEQVTFDEHAQNPLVVKELSSHGPGDAAKDWTSVFEAIRAGETAVVTPKLEQYLGRAAEGLEETLRKMHSQK